MSDRDATVAAERATNRRREEAAYREEHQAPSECRLCSRRSYRCSRHCRDVRNRPGRDLAVANDSVYRRRECASADGAGCWAPGCPAHGPGFALSFGEDCRDVGGSQLRCECGCMRRRGHVRHRTQRVSRQMVARLRGHVLADAGSAPRGCAHVAHPLRRSVPQSAEESPCKPSISTPPVWNPRATSRCSRPSFACSPESPTSAAVRSLGIVSVLYDEHKVGAAHDSARRALDRLRCPADKPKLAAP